MSNQSIFINKALLPHFTRATREMAVPPVNVEIFDVDGHPDTADIRLPKTIDHNTIFQLGMVTNSGYQLEQISNMLKKPKE